MRAPQIYSEFWLGILSYDVATYLYLLFFRLGNHFCSLKPGVNPCFPSYHAVITTCVETVDDWNIKGSAWPIGHDVVNLILCRPIRRDPCPSSVWWLLEKGVHNLCRSANSTSITPLLFFVLIPYEPVHASLISPEATLALKYPTILLCTLLFMMILSVSSYTFSISSSG